MTKDIDAGSDWIISDIVRGEDTHLKANIRELPYVHNQFDFTVT
jgi:hypothetical protein